MRNAWFPRWKPSAHFFHFSRYSSALQFLNDDIITIICWSESFFFIKCEYIFEQKWIFSFMDFHRFFVFVFFSHRVRLFIFRGRRICIHILLGWNLINRQTEFSWLKAFWINCGKLIFGFWKRRWRERRKKSVYKL